LEKAQDLEGNLEKS